MKSFKTLCVSVSLILVMHASEAIEDPQRHIKGLKGGAPKIRKKGTDLSITRPVTKKSKSSTDDTIANPVTKKSKSGTNAPGTNASCKSKSSTDAPGTMKSKGGNSPKK
eukprot:13222794-Ditylum_brightwellii.AAC.1